MLKFFSFFLIVLLGLFFSAQKPAFAETVYSNPWTTCIGDNKCDQSQNVKGGDITKTALDVDNAFAQCSNKYASESPDPSVTNCLQNFLAGQGYSPTQIAAFNTSRIEHNDKSPDCVQCIGFVAVTTALMTGDSNAIFRGDSDSNSRIISFAYELIKLPELKIYVNGIYQYSYYKVTAGSAQPGDIGSAAAGSDSGQVAYRGHALIVHSINKDKFYAIEDSWTSECYISIDAYPHSIAAYTFFRKR